MNRWLFIFGCCAAVAAGWFAGKAAHSAPQRTASPARIAPANTKPAHNATTGLSALAADPSPDALVLLAARISKLSADEIVEHLRGAGVTGASSGTDRTVAAAMIERLVALDPQRALEVLRTAVTFRHLLASSLGRAAANANAAAALNLAAGMRHDSDAHYFWRAFGTAASPAVFLALPDDSLAVRMAQSSFIRRWGDEDLAACSAWAATRPGAWEEAAKAIGRKDPRAALAWIESLQGKGSRANLRGAVYTEWAARDPLAAFAACQEDSSPVAQVGAITMGVHLANLPLEQGLSIATSAPDSPAIQRWLSTWAARDPATLVNALFAMPESISRQDLMKNASREWRKATSIEARTAVRLALEREPPGELRNEVSKAYIEASTQAGDVETAFTWLEKEIPAAQREEAARRLAATLTSSDPATMAANLERIPPAARPLRLRESMLEIWQQRDPAAAKAWAAEHPE